MAAATQILVRILSTLLCGIHSVVPLRTEIRREHCPRRPYNHVKYLRAGPALMPFRNWYTANTNHFHMTDSVELK